MMQASVFQRLPPPVWRSASVAPDNEVPRLSLPRSNASVLSEVLSGVALVLVRVRVRVRVQVQVQVQVRVRVRVLVPDRH